MRVESGKLRSDIVKILCTLYLVVPASRCFFSVCAIVGSSSMMKILYIVKFLPFL